MTGNGRYRVIAWGPGFVGKGALKGIITHPSLELVGLRVHSEAKEGRDAGELCEMPPTGIRSTRSTADILSLDADCVCYTATDTLRIDAAVDDLCQILTSGKNVVSTSMMAAVHPPMLDPRIKNRLEDACRQGGTSLLTTGIHPGFVAEPLPLLLTSISQSLESIRVSEMLDISLYADPIVLQGVGLGLSAEDAQSRDYSGVGRLLWGSAIGLLAEALQMKLEEIRVSHHSVFAVKPIDTATGGVDPGNVAGVHFLLEGCVAGEPRLIVDEYLCLDLSSIADIAPDWPVFPGHGGYRISVRGIPDLQVDVAFTHESSAVNLDYAAIAAGMRAVNSIPAICEASPGIKTFLDLGHAIRPWDV